MEAMDAAEPWPGLPRQMVPLPTYPGLQVHRCPLMVLVQMAAASHAFCPLAHSSCSEEGQKSSSVSASTNAGAKKRTRGRTGGSGELRKNGGRTARDPWRMI